MLEIALGQGLFYINGVAAGLTRGGGKFSVEREIRPIEADGDLGPVKDRLSIIKETAKLSMNSLQNILTNFASLYPAISTSSITGSFSGVAFSGTATKNTGSGTIAAGDYKTIQWVGDTLEGKKIAIVIENALNLEGIEWEMKDKDEIVPEVNYTSTYAEGSATRPWYVAKQD